MLFLFIPGFKLDLKLLVLLAPCLEGFSSTILAVHSACSKGYLLGVRGKPLKRQVRVFRYGEERGKKSLSRSC